MKNKRYLQSCRKVEGDEVYTPFYAVKPLLEFIPKDKIIWCPFDEDWSAFVQTLKEEGYKVVNSSLNDGQDFFEYEPSEWDIIISNPPFSKKDKVIERCYELNKPFCLLLPITALQSEKRYKCFVKGLELLLFDKRVDYHTWQNFEFYKTGNHFASAYFCKNILPEKIVFRTLEKYQKALKEI